VGASILGSGAVDNTQSFDTGGSPINTAFTVNSGSNLLLLVFVTWDNSSAHTIASVKWNTTETFSSLGAALTSSGGNHQGFYLVNPTVGSYNVTVDPSTGAAAASAVVGIVALQGVHQTTPYSGHATGTGADASAPYVSVLTVASVTDSVVIAVHGSAQNVTGTPASGGTELWDAVRTTNGTVSQAAAWWAGAASVVTDYTMSGLVNWAARGLSVDAAAASGIPAGVLAAILDDEGD